MEIRMNPRVQGDAERLKQLVRRLLGTRPSGAPGRPSSDYTLEGFKRNRCIFVHVPKTGGVSVARALFGNLAAGHITIEEHRRLLGRRRFAKYFKFTFVRNPYTRLYSAFRYLKTDQDWADNRAWAEQNLTGIDTYDDFVRERLTEELAWSKIHLRPQHHFVCHESGRLGVDFVGRFEHLARDFELVRHRLGAVAELPRLNESKLPAKQTSLSGRSAQKIRSIYARDFELFSYSLEPPELLS